MKNKNLRNIFLTARSTVNNIQNLDEVVFIYDPIIIMLTETWLHDAVRDIEVVPPDYTLIRNGIGSRGKGGMGIVMAINENFDCHQMSNVANTDSV